MTMVNSVYHTARSLLLPICLVAPMAVSVFAADFSSETASLSQRELDTAIQSLISQHGLIGDPAFKRGLRQIKPDEDALVKLGQILFFSQTLSGGYDSACAACHHPDFAMGDGLSLGIGVVPENSAAIGPGRRVNADRDLDPAADGGPNMFRNSLTIMNTALFDRVLLFDGRTQVLDSRVAPGGHGQSVNTPESGLRADSDPVSGLLAFQAKGAMVTDNEMRGYYYTEYTAGSEYRQHLIQRLRGEIDSEYNTIGAAAENWLQLFRNGLNAPQSSAEELITMPNIQSAIAAYEDSQIFIESPWKHYLEGELTEISLDAKRGARLFLTSKEEGGLGCALCHGSDRFTDEGFYNMGFPQLGRGFRRTNRTDLGRWLETGDNADLNAFRTPSLLNVAITGPWGHAGAFASLEDVIRYHANPRAAVNEYDFSLATLPQFTGTDISYPNAERYTREAIAQDSFSASEPLLPGRNLTEEEVSYLTAFLWSLSDECAIDTECLGQWAPAGNEDPDGHLLVRDESLAAPTLSGVSSAGAYPDLIALNFPDLAPLTTFADVQSCENNLDSARNTGEQQFALRSGSDFGLDDPQRYGKDTWFRNQNYVEATLSAGGVSSAYLDEDCWADLIFTGGEVSGMKLYHNDNGNRFTDISDSLLENTDHEFSGSAVADLNGDYRRELLFGNLFGQILPVFAQNSSGQYQRIANIPMARPTFGMSFAPLDDSGYPYFYLAHWSGGSGQNGASPALWKTESGNTLRPWDAQAGTTADDIDQYFNFTPLFVDLTSNGKLDLLITSDFETTSTLRNISTDSVSPLFNDETDYNVITDENGMGSTLLDIDNDGQLEWFVTSVFAIKSNREVIRGLSSKIENTMIPINWGDSGNRLYSNTSTSERLSFNDITDAAGIRMGYWGWGACAADFNNDGFIDIYHVNGYGDIPEAVVEEDWQVLSRNTLGEVSRDNFQDKPGLLYINNGDGTFTDQAESWALNVASDGRGLSCFDYNRDGDIDIAIFDHSNGLQFFENQVGHGPGQQFINIRLVGTAPNTDAIGAKVTLRADVGSDFGPQTQLRLSTANSQYNSQTVPDLHFGLGEADIIDEIKVQWMNGESLTCTNIPANRFIVIDQRIGKSACTFD